jgi:hypothetical protein
MSRLTDMEGNGKAGATLADTVAARLDDSGPSGRAADMARDAWFGLARAAHHHAYDLAPTAAELRRWHNLVSSVVADLSAG